MSRPKYTAIAWSCDGGIYLAYVPERSRAGWQYACMADVTRSERNWGYDSRRWQGVQFIQLRVTTSGADVLIISDWLLAALFAIAPILWLRPRKRTSPGGFPLIPEQQPTVP